jgi:hypothetical protein
MTAWYVRVHISLLFLPNNVICNVLHSIGNAGEGVDLVVS